MANVWAATGWAFFAQGGNMKRVGWHVIVATPAIGAKAKVGDAGWMPSPRAGTQGGWMDN
jgi:hypothetical protein